MTYELFATLYSQAREYNDLEHYIAERGWQDWMDDYMDSCSDDASRITDLLEKIYRISSMSLSELRDLAGLSRAEFSRVYQIPLATLESWEYNKRDLAGYKLMLIAYTVYMRGCSHVRPEN